MDGVYAGFHSFPTCRRSAEPGGAHQDLAGVRRRGRHGAGHDGAIRSISARALLMPRPHRPVVPAGDLKAEFALLREARLAVILSDWGHYDGGGHDHSSAHCSGRTINVWNRRCRLQWATAHYLAASPWS